MRVPTLQMPVREVNGLQRAVYETIASLRSAQEHLQRLLPNPQYYSLSLYGAAEQDYTRMLTKLRTVEVELEHYADALKGRLPKEAEP